MGLQWGFKLQAGLEGGFTRVSRAWEGLEGGFKAAWWGLQKGFRGLQGGVGKV